MRVVVLILVLVVVALSLWTSLRTTWTKTSAASPANLTSDSAKPAREKPSTKVDFSTQIKPMLQAKCQPCHFSGGKVYDKMPFDRPETIKTLGTKLFTRIKDENERSLIREFLAQD